MEKCYISGQFQISFQETSFHKGMNTASIYIYCIEEKTALPSPGWQCLFFCVQLHDFIYFFI